MFKALHLWLPAYLRHRQRRHHPGVPTDIMIAVCDHFEPLHGADHNEALRRLDRWIAHYPKLISPFRDADRINPRHTFFFPIEQYDREVVERLAQLCNSCGGEVEVHLHHDDDTPEALKNKLLRGRDWLSEWGFLSRDARDAVRYGFIHGNWALDNSDPAGRGCGVNNELSILKQTGCYADFTMPSAPHPTQTRIINRIYYARCTPAPKSHNHGTPVEAGKVRAEREDELLLVQGPLGLNWQRRKFGLLPKIENSDLTGANPPRPDRMRVWTRLGIHVQGQPNWMFIKLHTHGGIPRNMATLLEDPMRRFFDYLLANYNDGSHYRLHFVTAREMVNIIHAAEDGKTGDAGQYRDYRYRLQTKREASPAH